MRAFELSLCVVGIIVLFCSMLALPGDNLKSIRSTHSVISSEPLSIPQISCRITQTNLLEVSKQKRAVPGPLDLYPLLSYYIDSSKNRFIICLYGIAGISGGEIKQAYLLLDLPPPFPL